MRVAKLPTTAPWTRKTPLIAIRAARGDGTGTAMWASGAAMASPAHDGKSTKRWIYLGLEAHRPRQRPPVARGIGDGDRQLGPELLRSAAVQRLEHRLCPLGELQPQRRL